MLRAEEIRDLRLSTSFIIESDPETYGISRELMPEVGVETICLKR